MLDKNIHSTLISLLDTTGMTNLIMLYINNNNNNNYYYYYYYLLQLGCYPVAVVILHVHKTLNRLLLNLSREGYMRTASVV